jgi:hypothetical protein
MSEKIDYETFLPTKKDSEYYVVSYDGTYYITHTVLLNTGELLSKVCICNYKNSVNRLVHEEGGTYLGIGRIHQ